MVAATGDVHWLPADMRSDEIIINQWLADDLGAKVGDSVDITYFVIGPRRQLQEHRAAQSRQDRAAGRSGLRPQR